MADEQGFDLEEWRRDRVTNEAGTITFEIRKMPATKALRTITLIANAIKESGIGNIGRASLPVIQAIEGQDVSALPPAARAEMMAEMLQVIFGISEGYLEELRERLFAHIYYQPLDLPDGTSLQLWNGNVDNTDAVVDDWGFVIELMGRALVVNFSNTSLLNVLRRSLPTSDTSPSPLQE